MELPHASRPSWERRLANAWREPLPAEIQQTIPKPKNDDELWELLANVVGLRVPRRRVCPNHCSPFEALADAYFGRSRVAVWKASRGFGGKSLLLAGLSYTEAVTLGAFASLLGGSGEQSQRVHDYITGRDTNVPDAFWSAPNAPLSLLLDDPTKRETRLVNGGLLKVLLASQASVRGPHPQRLRMDECDEMEIAIFNAAQGQPMSARGIPAQTVASSTHQYPDGTMTEVLKRASERGWPVYEWCYHETMRSPENPDGWLDPAEIEGKQSEVPAEMWRVEYDLQEPSPENRAILTEMVELMFMPAMGEFEGLVDQYIEIEPPDPLGQYATGADWARDTNWSIIWTLRVDVRPARFVAFRRTGRKPWPAMVRNFDQQVARYSTKVGACAAAHDGTGLGNVVEDLVGVNALGVELVGRRRKDILSEYVAAIEQKAIVAPRIKFAYNEHKYARHKDLYGSGHLPDSICAGALAWYAATHDAGQQLETGASPLQDYRG